MKCLVLSDMLKTGEITTMIESCKVAEVSQVLSLFENDLTKIKSISCDMATGYNKKFAPNKYVIQR